MAFSWRIVEGALVKSISPMTRVVSVLSTTTKLSDDTDRRLIASAGYDSLVQCQCASSSGACRLGQVHEPFLREDLQDLLHALAAERLVVAERQLEGRALDVVDAGSAGCPG